MFACIYARRVAVSRLVPVAESFTPRFEVVGPLLMLDIGGLSRLFGSPDEIGAHLARALATVLRPMEGTTVGGTTVEGTTLVVPPVPPVQAIGRGGASAPPDPAHIPSCAIAATQTTAALLALGHPGLIVVPPGDEAAGLASLPVTVLAELERIAAKRLPDSGHSNDGHPVGGPHHGGRHFSGAATADAAATAAAANSGVGSSLHSSGGWQHPRSTHQASQTRRVRQSAQRAQRDRAKATQALIDVLHRWGIHRLGALAALPAADVSERLGQHGIRWQRMAIGEDDRPLVPWIADVPFEAALDLEWPIEGLEPLSFVLARLFEPLIARLERADRGAAIIQTSLRLVTRETYLRTLQLPAPMRDAKTLRALVLLDLESHPPTAAVDRVQIVIEPTPARVLQWELFTRAQPSPEQVSTLLARLKALAGEGHVGSPRLLDSWKPGAFEMGEFHIVDTRPSEALRAPSPSVEGMQAALRRFRLPIPARVTVREGRPVRVHSDRHGIPSGAVTSAAGPWRTSGQWWDLATAATPTSGHHGVHGPWDRDEWDVELVSGQIYRIFVERDVGQWFIEGTVD